MNRRIIAVLLTITNVAAFAGANLLEDSDLSHWTEKGVPHGYTANLYVPRQTGELQPAEGIVAPGSGEEEGAVELNLPGDRNLRLDLAQPIQLTPGRIYRLEVKIKWENLNPTGEGVKLFGPGFIVYAHGKSSHVMAVVKPSGASNGWVTVQTCFDLERYPDMEFTRVFFRSLDVEGRLWLKEAVLEEIGEMPVPPTRFLLPEGEIVVGPMLSL